MKWGAHLLQLATDFRTFGWPKFYGNMYRFILVIVSVVTVFGCSQKRLTDVDTTQYQLYQRIPSSQSGIEFENTITESLHFNVALYDNAMTGGGVGLLDVNNDGLLDIYLAGNQVQDRLYLNKGGLHFEDITVKAGIAEKNTWTSGVSIADVNGDGWDDIYLCKNLYDDPSRRLNVYYENQKDGTFRDRAGELGIADPGYSIIANFFDYDVDGDLDLYVGNQPPSSIYERPKLEGKINHWFTDRLYRNDGARFVEVTEAAGIKNYTYTLSVNTSDFNGDLLPDIYVACDYEEPDIMYINQGDGTFKNVIHETLRHMCNFGMGTDIADINNDGYMDIFTADMVAEDHYRNKTNMSGMNPEKFWSLATHGYHYQYMFNALQLNNGNGTYSEIAQLAGVAHTDWSWAAFFVDADHDGFTDLFVANGQMKDVRNKDYDIRRKKMVENKDPQTDMHQVLFEIAKTAPTEKIKNYFFRNNGDLTFTNQAEAWGFPEKTWTQGAAYGDLDNDGDLDIIIHNTNDPVMIYASQANDLRINNYLAVRVEGTDKNTKGINAKVTCVCGDLKQTQEVTPIRGYMSSVDPMIHFGLGKCQVADEIIVEWPDGFVLALQNIEANQTVIAKHSEARKGDKAKQAVDPVFEEIRNPEVITYRESNYDDYAREILLPYKLSTLGPVVAKADVNGDALDDIYIGGSAGTAGSLYVQSEAGDLIKVDIKAFQADAMYEDGCATFFDADGDRDMDLYVCSGSNEFEAGAELYQDRLYMNDGKGNYMSTNVLPRISASTSVAVPLDFDGDSDIDLFVGARQIPGQYGRVPRSLLLKNENGKYEDIGITTLPDSGLLGMVTDAVWVQGTAAQSQLVIVGEFMPIRMLQWYENVRFEETPMPGLQKTEGLWNRIVVTDIDVDGDLDLIAGNCGKNMKYSAETDKPFRMLVNDFDQNGSNDVYLGYYDKNDGQCYPVRDRECSSQQMPFVKTKFASYSDFAQATIDKVLEGKMEGAQELNARTFASGIFENIDGAFEFRPFRNEAQIAPVYGIVVADFNNDAKPDIFMAGNYYNREVETTRSDAGIGNLLLSTEAGSLDWNYVHPSRTGVRAYHDVRNVLLLRRKSDVVIAIANNNTPMQFYRPVQQPGGQIVQ